MKILPIDISSDKEDVIKLYGNQPRVDASDSAVYTLTLHFSIIRLCFPGKTYLIFLQILSHWTKKSH